MAPDNCRPIHYLYYCNTIKSVRVSVTEVGVAGWVWSTYAQCRTADLNWKL